jgi:hypothetical protein
MGVDLCTTCVCFVSVEVSMWWITLPVKMCIILGWFFPKLHNNRYLLYSKWCLSIVQWVNERTETLGFIIYFLVRVVGWLGY